MSIVEESPVVLGSVIAEEAMEGFARIRIEYVIGWTTSQVDATKAEIKRDQCVLSPWPKARFAGHHLTVSTFKSCHEHKFRRYFFLIFHVIGIYASHRT